MLPCIHTYVCQRTYTWWNCSKHNKTHNPDIPCEADPGRCTRVFAFEKELKKHYRAEHKAWAREHRGVTDTNCICEACETTFTRPDNRTRHLKKFPGCDEAIKKMKQDGKAVWNCGTMGFFFPVFFLLSFSFCFMSWKGSQGDAGIWWNLFTRLTKPDIG